MNDDLNSIPQIPPMPAPQMPPAPLQQYAAKAPQSAYQKAQEELDAALDQLRGLPDGLQSQLQRALRPSITTPAGPQCATTPKAPVSPVVAELEDTTRTIRDVVRKINDILAQVEL
jgi:hypothetical protein